MSWVTRPKWLPCPYMLKTTKHILLQHPVLLLGMYSTETLLLPRLFKWWPWVDLDLFTTSSTMEKMVSHKIPWKVLKIWPKNWYMQLTKWVYEDLWVQEMKVILRPLNQDSHILTISSISSKVTEPIITQVSYRAVFIHMFQRSRSHDKYDKKNSKSSSLEPIDRWSSYFICRIQYSSTAKIVEMIAFGWPWHF